MDRPKLEVADVFRRYGKAYREQHAVSLSPAQRRVLSAIELWRTAALGTHQEQCDQSRHERICYDSCRNRHCPKCQSLARAQWPGRDCRHRLPKQRSAVRPSLPGHIGNLAHHCRRSQTSGRRDRLLRRASQLGTEPAVSSPPPLRHPRRRALIRRRPLPSPPISPLSGKQNASSMLNHPLLGPSQYSITWDATRTASP